MPLRTMCFGSLPRPISGTTERQPDLRSAAHILFARYRLKVSGVHAGGNVTLVVNLQSGRDRLAEQRISGAVRLRFSGLVLVAETPISGASVVRCGPQPTTAVRVKLDLAHKPVVQVFARLVGADRSHL